MRFCSVGVGAKLTTRIVVGKVPRVDGPNSGVVVRSGSGLAGGVAGGDAGVRVAVNRPVVVG